MIPFSSQLVRGTLIRRYKRFLADIRLEDGQEITAHCANTGAMTSCGKPGDQVLLSYNPSPKRKLPYSWELTTTEQSWVIINTSVSNRLVRFALENSQIPELRGYDTVNREVKFGLNSRLDFHLQDNKGILRECYIEVKSVTLKRDHELAFPDTVSTRGTKHLNELAQIAQSGRRAVLFYLVNRSDGDCVKVAKDLDPNYAKAMKNALDSGVEVLAYRSKVSHNGIQLGSSVDFIFNH